MQPGITKISIGIQARSTSHRFPGKVHELLARRSILDHVVTAVEKAAVYINNWNSKKMIVDVAVLIPEGDEIRRKIRSGITIVEGSENDVLSRYVLLQKASDADYIVRVTGDCPLIPPYVISKLITLATANAYDYVSNVDERCRTTPDGFDAEVISKRLLYYADSAAIKAEDREHVTTIMRKAPPEWIRHGTVVNFLDLSGWKLSIDTSEDLAKVREECERVDRAYKTAVSIFGRNHVHRL